MLKRFAQTGLFFIILCSLLIVPLRESPVSVAFAVPAKALAAPLVHSAPVRVIIPKIALNSKVKALGKDEDGNMAVPSGKTTDVGWYKYGTLPGNVGSAVLDAHVFAAFGNLKNLEPGDDIYVLNSQNQKLHFVVSAAKTYKLGELSSATLFGQIGQNDTPHLNLITCAGKLTADRTTYDHRLVVFTTLVGVEEA